MRTSLAVALRQLVPPRGLIRSLAAQAMAYAVGFGVFQAGSAVFFTKVLGLDPTQVGLGLSAAAGVSMLVSVPLGTVIDRFGAQKVWLVSLLVEAALFAAYPFVEGFVGFLVVVTGLAVAAAGTDVARSVYSIAVLPSEDRVRALAYQRTALNLGFAVGAGISGLALAVGTATGFQVMIVFAAAMPIVTAVFVRRLPRVARQAPAAEPPTAAAEPRRRRHAALADRPFLLVTLVSGILGAHHTLMLVVLPLWILDRTDAPAPVVALILLLNTALAVLLQVRASRGAETAPGAGRALRRGGLLLAFACLILPISTLTTGPVTIAILLAGAVVLTLAELVQSAGDWGLAATLPPDDRRGEYLGVFRLGRQLQQLAGPVALTALTVGTGGWGWLPMVVLFLAVAMAARPAVGWAVRRPRIGSAPTAPITTVTPVP
ncbi:MFS transporter [Plantactinospora sp. GCM10030261]|uniref:MFS transporter n=1 Tax=Plantactinospora sp. GCM10030261 TaxID=3273420 RepID=UPI0036214CDB